MQKRVTDTNNRIYLTMALITTFLMSTRYMSVCAIIVLGVHLFVSVKQGKLMLIKNKFLKLFVSITVFILIQIILSLFSGYSSLFSMSVAVKEIIRCCIYLVCLEIMQTSQISIKAYLRIWKVILYIVVSVAVLQYIKVVDIDSFLKSVYGDSVQFYNSQQTQLSAFRCGSVFINPNVFSTFLMGTLACYLFVIQNTEENNVSKLITIIMIFVGMVLSGSRTGLVIGVAVLLVHFRYQFIKIPKKFILQIFLCIVAFSLVFVFLICFTDLKLNTLFDLRIFDISSGLSNSFGIKMDIYWNLIKNANVSNILFGYGPYDYAASPDLLVDFDFGYFTIFFGFAGVILYMMLLRAFATYRKNQLKNRVLLNRLSLVVIILFGFTAGVYFNLRIFTIFEVMFLPCIYNDDNEMIA